MVAYLGALLIFAALAAACWFVSVAVYKGTLGGPDPAAAPHYRLTAAVAIAVTSMTSFIPFPGATSPAWRSGPSPRSAGSG